MTSDRVTTRALHLGTRKAASRKDIPQHLSASLASRVVVMIALCISTVYFLLPVYWVLVAATKSTGGLFNSFSLWFSQPQFFQNIAATFTYSDGLYGRWLLNSVLYAGVSSLVSTLLAAAAGYAMAIYDFKGKGFLFTFVLAGVMLPSTALALPVYLMMSKAGLSDTYFSMILPNIVSPFGVYLSRIYASSSIPSELLDAARVDGAGETRIFWTVALRMMTPALVTTFLFHSVGVWNNYLLPLLMISNQKLYPVILGLTTWNSQSTREPQLYVLTVTGAFVSVVVLLIAIISLQRFWRGGLAAGAIK